MTKVKILSQWHEKSYSKLVLQVIAAKAVALYDPGCGVIIV